MSSWPPGNGGGVFVPEYAEGYLRKLGGVGGKNKQKRWFELRGQRLMYYVDPPKGSVDLSRPVKLRADGDEELTITGDHLQHAYTLCAADDRDRAVWIAAIKKSMAGPRPGWVEERVRSLESEREALAVTSKQIANEYRAKAHEAAEAREAAEMAETRCSELTAELDRQRDATAKATRLAEGHQADITELSASLEASASLAKQHAEAAAELKRGLAAAESRADALSDDLARSLAKVESLRAALADEQQASSTLVAELSEYRSAAEAKRKGIVLEMESKLQEAVRAAQETEDGLRHSLREERAAAASRSERLEAATAVVADLERELDEARREHRSAQRDASSERAAAAALLDALRQEKEALSREVQEGLKREEIKDSLLAEASEQQERFRRLESTTDSVRTTAQEPDSTAAGEEKRALFPESPAASTAPPTNDVFSNATRPSSPAAAALYTTKKDMAAVVTQDEAATSAVICKLPLRCAVEVSLKKENRVRLAAPVVGWIDATCIVDAPVWDEEAAELAFPTQLEEGSPAELAFIKSGRLATWLDCRIVDANTEYLRAHINQTPLAATLGMSKRVVTVPRTRLRTRRPRWKVFDPPDGCRIASSAGYHHPPGYGCHRGRLNSKFAWFADPGDTHQPWYAIDLEECQSVAGVVIAAFCGQFESYVTKFAVQGVTYRVDVEHDRHNPVRSHHQPEHEGSVGGGDAASQPETRERGGSSFSIGSVFRELVGEKEPDRPLLNNYSFASSAASSCPSPLPTAAGHAAATPQNNLLSSADWFDIQIFHGEATDELSEAATITCRFDAPVLARMIRIRPLQWKGSVPCLKVGVLIDEGEKTEEVKAPYCNEEVNKWLHSSKRDAFMHRLEQKSCEVEDLRRSLEERSEQLTKEKKALTVSETRLAAVNAALTRNVFQLSHRGTMFVRKAVPYLSLSELAQKLEARDSASFAIFREKTLHPGITFDASLRVTSFSEDLADSGFEVGMKVIELKGHPVGSEAELAAELTALLAEYNQGKKRFLRSTAFARHSPRQAAVAAPTDATITFTVEVETVADVVRGLEEERAELRRELERQREMIKHLQNGDQRLSALAHETKPRSSSLKPQGATKSEVVF